VDGASKIPRSSIKQIIKFEKLLEQFCESIGVEKRSLLSALQGPRLAQNYND
jgi:hypothetical protein